MREPKAMTSEIRGKREIPFTLGYLNLWWGFLNLYTMCCYNVNYDEIMVMNECNDVVEWMKFKEINVGFMNWKFILKRVGNPVR